MSDFKLWWASLPPITKYLCALTLFITLLGGFGLIPPYYLIFIPKYILVKFQIWRLVTPFFFHGKIDFGLIIDLIFLYRHSMQLEKINFPHKTAEYAFFIFFGMVCIMVTSCFIVLPLLSRALLLFVIYYWSRQYPDQQMSFMFGLRFKAPYLPWVMVAFRFVLGGTIKGELIGIVIGHLYYYLEVILPATRRIDLLKTPQFMYHLFPPVQGRVFDGNRIFPAPGNVPPPTSSHTNWGPGRRLDN